MTSDERWLAEMWPFARAQLPGAPATALEIGCGPLGGFVPALLEAGYEAVGVDPEAPSGHAYHQIEFECYDVPRPVDTVIACVSLHHVADLEVVLDRVAEALVPGGTLVVIEWAHELFDEPTARWCFARLAPAASHGEHSWLLARRDEHAASGQSWDAYCRRWVEQEGLHTGEEIVRGLDARFDRRSCTNGPYFFADLDGVSQADEQAAIDSGQIQATGIRYAGTRRPS
jgi:SAM-dependent methyltransferase